MKDVWQKLIFFKERKRPGTKAVVVQFKEKPFITEVFIQWLETPITKLSDVQRLNYIYIQYILLVIF
jgi:hypothetical protein